MLLSCNLASTFISTTSSSVISSFDNDISTFSNFAASSLNLIEYTFLVTPSSATTKTFATPLDVSAGATNTLALSLAVAETTGVSAP